MNEQFDLVAIGDTVVDCFIKLKDAHVTCDIDKENCQICMNFRDKIPYEDVYITPAVGNSPNVAVGAARLGLKAALVSNLGDDQNGKDCLDRLTEEKVDSSLVKIEKDQKTNYHYVLWYGDDRTILVKHEDYNYQLPNFETKWIYLSSIGENSLDYHEQIVQYLNSHPETKLAFQPGTFQIKAGYEKLNDLYKRSNLFFCNKQEAEKILDKKEASIMELLKGLATLGPKVICITDAENGAYAYDGQAAWQIGSAPSTTPPLERTGAGDAAASAFLSAFATGQDIPTALTWAMINSQSVIHQIGAQAGLLTREQLEKSLSSFPANHKPQPLA